MRVTLGHWVLEFEPGGKLRQLVAIGRHPLLHESDYQMDLGEGRHFVPGGWDECFPTIDACESIPVMGELVRQSPRLVTANGLVTQTWQTDRYVARRSFTAPLPQVLELSFHVQNTADQPLPFLWASHALFTFAGLTALLLPDGRRLDQFSLDGTATKLFAAAGSPLLVRRDDVELRLETDQAWWGIWLNRGGWPAHHPAGFGCIGIEATNADAERPQGASLAPGAAFEGSVRLSASSRRPPLRSAG